jgi:hypothetical protein
MSDQPEKSTYNGKFPTRTGILFLLATLSIITSVFGDWINASCKPGYGEFLDFLLTAVAHLTLNGFEPITGNNPGDSLIRLARFLALFFVIIAAGTLLDSAFHFKSNFRRWKASSKEHDLVIGLGWHGQALLLDGGKEKMIAIDPNPDSIAREICERKGIPLLAIDACGEEIFNLLAGLKYTKRVFIAAGSDDLNIRIAHHLASKCAANSRMEFSISLKDHKSTGTLISLLGDKSYIGLHTYNNAGSTAQAIFDNDDYRIDRFENGVGDKTAQIVLIGDGSMGEELLRHSLQHCIFEKNVSMKVDVLWPKHDDFSKRWSAEHPCYTRGQEGGISKNRQRDPIAVFDRSIACLIDMLRPLRAVRFALGQISTVFQGTKKPYILYTPKDKVWLDKRVLPPICFHELPVSARGLIDWCESHIRPEDAVTTVIVAMHDPTEACRIADWVGPKLNQLAQLAQLDKQNNNENKFEAWVYLNSRDQAMRKSISEKMVKSYPTLKLRIFFDYLDKFNRDFAIGMEVDDVAKRVNAMYALKGIELEEKVKADPKINAKWCSLDVSDKESSRQSAVHARIKSRIYKRLIKKYQNKEAKEAEVRNQLAEIEHRRWCAEYLLNGFEPLTRNKKNDQLNATEKANIDAWFHAEKSKNKKKEFKAMRLHVDLHPYRDLTSVLGKDIGEKEQKKDHVIALNDWVLSGVKN